MHGELRQGAGEKLAGRIGTDSRTAQAGDLFFALKGEQFDAHDFLDEVAGKGVAACVVARGKKFPPGAVIEVDDPRAALGRLAAAYRAIHRPGKLVAGAAGLCAGLALAARPTYVFAAAALVPLAWQWWAERRNAARPAPP